MKFSSVEDKDELLLTGRLGTRRGPEWDREGLPTSIRVRTCGRVLGSITTGDGQDLVSLGNRWENGLPGVPIVVSSGSLPVRVPVPVTPGPFPEP